MDTTKPRKLCAVEGCGNLARFKHKRANGNKEYGRLCTSHHKLRTYQLQTGIAVRGTFYAGVPNDKCSICGWSHAPCDRHRIVREKGYVEGNVAVLCPNCHRLVTLGKMKLKPRKR